MRKCIVTIPAIERYIGRNAAGELQREVLKEAETHNAVFHQWIKEEYPVAPSLLVGGDNGGQYSHTYALVEYEDGTVHRVKPEHIRFVE